MSKPILIVMCGLQGSGKSTIANTDLKDKYNATVYSSDKLRKEYPTFDNNKIFETLYSQIDSDLSNGKNCILDATNITMKSRRAIFNNLKSDFYSICYIMNTPYQFCLNNLVHRNKDSESHFVPIDALTRYYHSFEVPFYEEGWNEIIINHTPDNNHSQFFIEFMNNKAEGFNQKTKYHNDDLLSHMFITHALLEQISDDDTLLRASLMHDYGKLYTQTFKEGDENAHYYNHANVSAYEVLSHWSYYDEKGYDIKNTLDCIFYINYHMLPFNVQSEKSNTKWERIFGTTKWYNLKKLNEADKYRKE